VSYIITGPSGSINPKVPYPLVVPKTIEVAALCFGLIPHEVRLELGESAVFLLGRPGTLLDMSLLVSSGLMDDGDVSTVVFNLSNKAVRIRKGSIISWLVEVA
jgi:hypothetical protein